MPLLKINKYLETFDPLEGLKKNILFEIKYILLLTLKKKNSNISPSVHLIYLNNICVFKSKMLNIYIYI